MHPLEKIESSAAFLQSIKSLEWKLSFLTRGVTIITNWKEVDSRYIMSYLGGEYMYREKRPSNGVWDTTKGQSERWDGPRYTSRVESYGNPGLAPIIKDGLVREETFPEAYPDYTPDAYYTKTETVVQSDNVPHMTKYGSRYLTIGLDTAPVPPSHYQKTLVEEYITKIHTEASKPSKPTLVSSVHWHQTSNAGNYRGTNSNNTYHETSSNYGGTNGWSNAVNRNGKPTIPTASGWVKPSRVEWRNNKNTLSRPTGNIGTAINYLKTTSTTPVPMVPRAESYSTTIDSSEAQKRYGDTFPSPSQAINTAETTYISTIDSREALRRYNGQKV